MKNKILELLRYQGISFFVSTVSLFLLIVPTAAYSFIKGKNIYFPKKVLSFIAESSSIEIKFMPHFIIMFIIFSILFGIVLFFICKFYKKSKN
jgi:ribose/xylose/arabinose/galactoside ABC-type transport system permease subunit